jgi:hypothetical protein
MCHTKLGYLCLDKPAEISILILGGRDMEAILSILFLGSLMGIATVIDMYMGK